MYFPLAKPRTLDDNQSLYQLLLHAQVFMTNEITTKFEVTQNGQKIQSTLDKSTLHIKEDHSKLQIYVPKDPKDRELCYCRLLPARLLSTLMTEVGGSPTAKPEPSAVGIVADILNCSDLIINDILEDAGVVRVPFPETYVLDVPDSCRVHLRQGHVPTQVFQMDLEHRSDSHHPNTPRQHSDPLVIYSRLRHLLRQVIDLVIKPSPLSCISLL